MAYCRLETYMYCLSLDKGLNIIVVVDYILCIIFIFFSVLPLPWAFNEILSRDYQQLSVLILFFFCIFVALNLVIKCGIGTFALCKRHSQQLLKFHFFFSFGSNLLSIISLIAGLVVGYSSTTTIVIFSLITIVSAVYYTHSTLVIYSIWVRNLMEEQKIEITTMKKQQMERKVDLIMNDVKLSVIPEISIKDEASSQENKFK